MCEMCLNQLRHEAMEYFQCLYEDDEMSEETYNQIMAFHECMKTHELLKQIADLEKALYNRDERKRTREHLEKMVEKWVVKKDIEKGKAEVKQLYKDQQVQILKEELRTFILNQIGWTEDQVELLTLDGLLNVARESAYTPLLEGIE